MLSFGFSHLGIRDPVRLLHLSGDNLDHLDVPGLDAAEWHPGGHCGKHSPDFRAQAVIEKEDARGSFV
jgi:hypothetical protein